MRKLTDLQETQTQSAPLNKPLPHESAHRQVSGMARYVDDIPTPQGTLHAAVGTADITHGKVTHMDLSAVCQSNGVIDVMSIDDVPGHKDIGPVFPGDPILCDGTVKFHGQPLFVVAAKTYQQARIAATQAQVSYQELSPVLLVSEALKQNKKVRPSHSFGQGDPQDVFANAALTECGQLNIGGQEHLYLEGQVSLAVPEEDGRMMIYTSSQHPSEVQKLVAEVLGVKLHKVTVDMRRMGGGFGGKETQAAQWACLAALLAARNQKPVKLRLPRQQDMQVTGKRHPFENHYRVAFDKQGKCLAADITVNGNCGHSPDLSEAIVDRAMFHVDNGYQLGATLVTGHRLETQYVSHTAFRGFGGPQGMIMAEAIMDRIARTVGKDPLTVRKENLYNKAHGNITPYGMDVGNNILPDMIAQLEDSSQYWQRRQDIAQFNATSPIIKKGLAMTPVKFGISFTSKHLNQAGALIHIYTDGSIQVNHGGTEMGQGLHTKVAQIVAHEFGVDINAIEVTATRTDKVPNTSPTAASSGTDLNGKAAQNACLKLKQRLTDYLVATHDVHPSCVRFVKGNVEFGSQCIGFVQLIQQAYFARVSLSATGYYKTPKIYYDRESGTGRPFYYFAYGVALSEVSVDTLTGEYRTTHVDILHDVGNSLNPAIDRGQIEGGFIQGMGWLTTEELLWNEDGKLISNNLATYKIPAIGDTPEHFSVSLYQRPNDEDSIYHSKAVGEPPFMLAISVWCAIKDAISSLSDYRIDPQLHTPATPEKVLMAINAMQGAK